MGLRVKILGLGLLAVLAASAAVVINASATAGGHFTSNRDHTTLEVIEQAPDVLEFFALGKGIICNDTTYHGTFTGTKITAVTLTPEYKECMTTGGKANGVTIVTHDCTFEFTVRPNPETNHNTAHIRCLAGKKITITDPETLGGSCTVEVGPQTVSGVVYKKIQWQGTASLTAEFTVKNIQYTLHNGPCTILGTTRNDGELKGSVIVKAWNADEPKQGADIEAT